MKEEKIQEVTESTKMEDSLLAAPRGTRDLLFEDKIQRDQIVAVLKNVFELYGFNPWETPALERWEVLSSKYAGGAEILKETYKLEDQGGRQLGLRYDLTVPLCRVIAGDSSMPMPIKRYAIASVWRDGPIKLGRYREFVQCDVDIVGAKSGLADAEIISLVCDAFNQLGIDYVVKVNNRKLLEGLLESLGVETKSVESIILTIDKLAKIGSPGVEKELIEKGFSIPLAKKITSTFQDFEDCNFEQVFAKCEKLVGKNEKAKQGLTELEEVFDFLASFQKDVSARVIVDASLARGLAYYTGSVFEVYAKASKVTSSIAGGGRYDELIGKFAGRESIPAVGISFGLDTIVEVLKLQSGKPAKKTVADIYVIPIKTIPQCITLASELRSNGIRTALDLMGRSISKNLDYASKQGVKYVAIVGPKEAEQKKLTLRNLETGEEQLLTLSAAVEKILSG
ncbi:MAG: histidine--tRNA ligase [Candidatus Micrarchaeota archaeon]|nr:histidine--tRNA ligase [Candidatus Micrarchaeota archaeon]